MLSYNIEVMRLMRVFVTNRPVTLSPKDWDIILCRTVSMVQVSQGSDKILYSDSLLLERSGSLREILLEWVLDDTGDTQFMNFFIEVASCSMVISMN